MRKIPKICLYHKLKKFFLEFQCIIFNFEISGKDDKDSHLLNKHSTLMTLFVFHYEISGKDEFF